MAIDPRIPGMVQVPDILGTMQQAQQQAQQTRRQQQVMQADDMRLRAGQQEMQERDAFLRELRAAPDLSNDTLDRLTKVAPTVAMEFRKNLQQQRAQAMAEAKAQAELEAKQAERGFSLLGALDEETFSVLAPTIAKLLPDLAPVLGEQYDPARVAQLRTAGLTAKEQLEADRKALDDLASGKHGSLAGALAKLSDPAERAERLQAWGFLGAPKGVLAALTQAPDEFTMTPQQRETLEGQAEGREIQRDGQAAAAQRAAVDDRRADRALGISQAQLDLARQREGRVAKAEAAGGGSGAPAGLVDAVMANPSIYSTLTPSARTAIAPALAQRGFKGFQDGSGGGKPSTGAQKRVANFFNRAKQADDELQGLEPQIAQMGLAGQTRMEWAPNFAQSQLGQSYLAAQRAFTEARLRKDSGAAIPDSEFDNDRRTYFAQPGDSPATLAQKARARAAVLSSLAFESGPALTEFYGDEASDLVADYRARAQKGGAAPRPAPAGGATSKPTLRFNPKTGAFEKVGG